MKKYLILCIDDEREVLESVIQDLAPLENHFIIEATESVQEAREVIEEYAQEEIKLALVLCDHIMPGQTGISFLIELNKNEQTKNARKLLLTGQADLDDTIQAVNQGGLDFYLSKPWDGDVLMKTVIQQLSHYIIENDEDLMPWGQVLDVEMIFNAMSERRNQFGE